MFTQVKQYYLELIPKMSEIEWLALQEKLQIKFLQKGEILHQAGDICRYVSFINYGLVRFYYVVDGKEISTGFVPENQYVSEYESFLTQQPAPQCLDVLEDTEVIALSFNDMQHLYDEFPIFQVFGRKIAELLFIFLSRRNTMLLSLSPEAAYKSMLDNSPNLLQRIPQYMLASSLGITPEHLSRIRRKMAKGI